MKTVIRMTLSLSIRRTPSEASMFRERQTKNQPAPTWAWDVAYPRVGVFLQDLLDQLVRDRVADELGVAPDLELLHDPGLVRARSLGAEVQIPGDRLEGLSRGELGEDLALPVREQLV